MEAREELRLFRAGFWPVSRRYVVAALLAAVAAMAAELWIVQLHATWPEACFKPWRSSLALVLHAFLTTLRLLRSSASNLCSYYGKYRVCVGFLSLLLFSYLYFVLLDVIASASLQRIEALLSNMLDGKFVVDHALESEHVLNNRLPWNSCDITEKNHPSTEWRFIGEDVKFTCHHVIQSPKDFTLHDHPIVWAHNGTLIRDDDPGYEITRQPVKVDCTSKPFHSYNHTLELMITFVESSHFGEYDCIFLLEMDRRYHSNVLPRNLTDPHQGRPQHTFAGFKRIGRVHLKQIFPETRVMVMPIGGIMLNVGAGWLLTQEEKDEILFEYSFPEKELIFPPRILGHKKSLCSPFTFVYYQFFEMTFPYELKLQSYDFSDVDPHTVLFSMPFPPEAFGKHQLTFHRDITNSTTGMRELREVSFPVTFNFKPSPPILMEIFLKLSNISDVTVSDLSDPFFVGYLDICIAAEGLVLFSVVSAVVLLTILMIKLTFQNVLVPLWRATFLLGFQRPLQETLAGTCVHGPQEPELRYDVFVSYAHEDPEDRGYVLQVLLPKLQRLGLSVCLPERERATNETELRGTSCLVQACTFYVVVVSPSYIECGTCNRLELPFILSRFQHREVDDHQVVLVKLRACIIPGGLRCSLPVVDLTRNQGQGQLDDVIRGWFPRNQAPN